MLRAMCPATASDHSSPASNGTRAVQRRRRRLTGLIVGGGIVAVMAGGIATAAALGNAPESPLTVVDPTSAFASTPAATTAAPTTAAPTSVAPTTAPATVTPSPSPTASPTSGYDLDSPDSLTVVVNKHRPLVPSSYVPQDLVAMEELGISSMNGSSLRKPAADAIVEMFAAASAAGHTFDVTSGYRDYDVQSELYAADVEQNGLAAADALTSRPGHSEHQTGLSADISAPGETDCILTECFAQSAPGQWLAAHSWEYGFILRYPEGADAITGIQFEPWHFRFVGVDVAAAFHASGAATFEEFLELEPAPAYR